MRAPATSALGFVLLLVSQSVGNAAEIAEGPSPTATPAKITPCGEKPDIFSEHSQELSFEMLPKSIFVGRVAHFWIESKDGSTKIFVKQNFKTGKKEFICATLGPDLNEHFALMAPTLIDRSNAQKTGSTIWQFQVLVQGKRLGIWNQKTKMVSASEFLKNDSESLQWIEDNQLRIRRSHGQFKLLMVVEFDQVDSI